MPAMSKRPSSLGAGQAGRAGGPPGRAGDSRPGGAGDPPPRGGRSRGRVDTPRGGPPRGHGEPQRRIEPARRAEPLGRIEAQRGIWPQGGIDAQGRGEPPWPPSTPPGNTGFTHTPSDSAPSTGSLPAITGGLIRRQGTFTSRISRDGSSEFPVEASRYQLYASLGCPWSQRALIACRLLGLDRVIGLTLTDPVADEHGWQVSDDSRDPLARRRFLLGDLITEADVRLYPTLARFDAVYYHKFNCNLRRLSDYRHLWAYTRDLYNHPGFGETTDLRQIKRHYYQSAEWITASAKYGIVPIGPQINWNEPHGRATMPG